MSADRHFQVGPAGQSGMTQSSDGGTEEEQRGTERTETFKFIRIHAVRNKFTGLVGPVSRHSHGIRLLISVGACSVSPG